MDNIKSDSGGMSHEVFAHLSTHGARYIGFRYFNSTQEVIDCYFDLSQQA